MLDPVLVLEVVAGAGQVRFERLGEGVAVVGVDAAEPLAGRVAKLGLGVAQHLLPAGEEQAVLAHVPVPEAVVGALHGERVALLGLGQAGERVLVRDRVAQGALEQVEVGHVLGNAELGRREVGVAVGTVVEQQDGRVGRVGDDQAGEVEPAELAVDQEGVVRVLVERGERGLVLVTQWMS